MPSRFFGLTCLTMKKILGRDRSCFQNVLLKTGQRHPSMSKLDQTHLDSI
jgi:hypothetical protein